MRVLKATIIPIIVALLFSGSVVLAANIAFGPQIEKSIALINQMSVKRTDQEEKISFNEEKKRLEHYPEYGTQYGRVYIDSIGIDLPVYLGDSKEILKLGVGHYDGSYFPGEGCSIIYAGHNTTKFLKKLPNVKVGQTIRVKTDYGEFNYKIYDTQIIYETEEYKLPIQTDKEILMVYTCYPVGSLGHKDQRFVVYAKPVEE